MSFTTPTLTGPDSVLRSRLDFSTTLPNRFFTGEVDASTVDVQVSVRGSPFSSDPDLIILEGTDFTVPNPKASPEGLALVAGTNNIRIRAVSNTGSVSDPAVANVRLVQESDIGVVATPPTNVTLERFDESVLVRVEGIDDNNLIGFNFYASQFPGGGATGYSRININPVTDGEFVEVLTEVTNLEVDGEIVTNPDGTAVADPLYLKLEAAQVRDADFIERIESVTLTDELSIATMQRDQDNRIQTEFNEIREIPENVERIRTSVTVSSISDREFYSFLHDRLADSQSTPPTVPYGRLAAVPADESLFYVVTSILFDPSTQSEIESPFSIEVSGNPLTVTSQIGVFPQVSSSQISLDMISAIRRARPQVALQPGSVIRDTVVDPATTEAERIRYLVTFLNQTQSFSLLLQLDGIDSRGNSTPVSRSPRKLALKRALFLTSDSDVQAVVDGSFDRLAANYGVGRGPGDRSRGEVTFYTNTRPTQSIQIPAGTIVSSGAVRFMTTVAASIPVDQLASYYNPSTGRYSVTVPIRAEEPGSNGNVGPGQIRTIVGMSGLSVTNTGRTYGGDDQDTNLDIATRAMERLASVDSGRERGYLNVAAGVSGVRQAFVVPPGDDFMQRDFDPDYNKHTGGKVDLYVRGNNQAVVTDTFAFTFDIANNIQFVIVGNPANLTFRALDSRLTANNPIAEMLDEPVLGYEFRNATTGESFDLTGVTITRYDTIQLSTSVDQPDVDLGDVVFGDYRFRTGEEFVLPRQPVVSVTSVTGTVSGSLPSDGYSFVRADSPLQTGGSSRAQDYVRITETTTSTGITVPSGETIDVTSEPHVLIGERIEYLDNLGAQPLSINVYNSTRTVQYKEPNDPSLAPDFTIVSGTQTTPVGIKRTPTSTIGTGTQVVVDYSHEENFVVEYVVNNLPGLVQDQIDEMRHVDADVLVKGTVRVPINITATIILQRTVQQETVDPGIRAALAQFFDGLRLGTPVRQSDIIGILERTSGVSHVITPLTLLARGEDAPIIRETLATNQPGDVTYLAGDPLDPISTPRVSVYLVSESLTAATTDGGGPANLYRAVYEDDVEMELQAIRPETIGSSSGKAYIIGTDGLVIEGFSDDTTLEAEFPTANSQEIEAVRKSRTANRIMVSVSVDDAPSNHEYFVTYYASSENTGVRDIEPGPIEELVVGELIFTYEEDRA